jgi:triosephosphate isomerase
MTPILCVGESLEIRRDGGQVSHTTGQLKAALAGVSAGQAKSIVVAYEPIWAIGTGEVATPEDAQAVCTALRDTLEQLYSTTVSNAVRVLYGGSVKPDNIAGIMAQADVDGALVGGASLAPEDFVRIVRYNAEIPA